MSTKNNRKKKNIPLKSISDCLSQDSGLRGLIAVFDRLDNITNVLHTALPQLGTLCHCGAIDDIADMLIIYTNSQAHFHIVKNYLPLISEALENKGIFFSQILIKIRITEPFNKAIKINCAKNGSTFPSDYESLLDL